MKNKTHRNPWSFMPVLDFLMGISHGFASQFLNLVFKTMGASNTIVGLVSLLQLPLGLKAFWAPVVQQWGTYRQTALRMLFVFAALIGCMAAVFLLPVPGLMWLLAAFFFVTIFVISFFLIGYGGYKVSALTGKEIALFAGISSAVFRLGLLFGNSFLLILVGKIADKMNYNVGWSVGFAILAMLVAGLALYLKFILPHPPSDKGKEHKLTPKSYMDTFVGFFKKQGGWLIVLYLFTCRMGEGIMNVIKNPFVLDPLEEGGLGMSVADIGVMGPFTLVTLILAGIAGGLIVKAFGLRKCFFAMGALMFVPNLAFSLLAKYPQTDLIEFWGLAINPWLLGAFLIEIVGYGLSFATVVTFSALIAKTAGANKATFAAITSSVNLLGFTLGGSMSGAIQEAIGYFWTFNASILLSLPGWILILFLPIRRIQAESDALDVEAAAVEAERKGLL